MATYKTCFLALWLQLFFHGQCILSLVNSLLLPSISKFHFMPVIVQLRRSHRVKGFIRSLLAAAGHTLVILQQLARTNTIHVSWRELLSLAFAL